MVDLFGVAIVAVLVLYFYVRKIQKKARKMRSRFVRSAEEALPRIQVPPTVDKKMERPRLEPFPATETTTSTPQTSTPEAFDPADNARPLPEGAECVGSAYVIDGDTIVIKGMQIRLFGVDAPELNHPYGKKAKWALVQLCKGLEIRAELIAQDAHDRTVAKCFLPDGRDLSAEMVKQGLALDWPKFSGGIYSALETPDARKKLWLANARQKGHMHVWRKFEAEQSTRAAKNG